MAAKPQKVLVIGSGPIVIGQAAEFDYAGTQACKALREEGVYTVLVNSNPATIMTDQGIADAVYIEPLTVDVLDRIIAKERPDGILPTLGGQTGLNLAVDLAKAGILEKYGVRLLGTPLKAIQTAEDREEFRQLLLEIKEPLPPSISVSSHGNRLAFGDFDDEGEDYTVGDILTPVEGTGDPLATFRVDSVNGSGEIQTASVVNRGAYSVSPGDGDMAGGTGNGAEFEFIITDNVLAAADVADNLGDHSLLVELLPPAAEHDGAIAVPSAVLVVTDEGVAAAALDAQLAPDSFILPNLLATGKRS